MTKTTKLNLLNIKVDKPTQTFIDDKNIAWKPFIGGKRHNINTDDISSEMPKLKQIKLESNWNLQELSTNCKCIAEILNDITIKYIKMIVDDCKTDDYFFKIISNIENIDDFVKIVYKYSKDDTHFWSRIKLYTLGSSSSITLCDSLNTNTISNLTPLQYGGIKGLIPNNVTLFNQELGSKGEDLVFDELGEDNLHVIRPGKICKKNFPVFSTTPDYLFMSGDDDRVPDSLIDFGISGSVIGIGETKTSNLNSTVDKIWTHDNITVRDLICKCKPSLIQDFFNERKRKRKKWLDNFPDLRDNLKSSVEKSLRWKMIYYTSPDATTVDERRVVEFDMSNPGNRVIPQLFNCSHDIGKQMLCEAISVLEYVNNDDILIKGYFPSMLDITPRNIGFNSDKSIEEIEEEEAENDDDDDDQEIKSFKFELAFILEFEIKLPMKYMVVLDKIITERLLNSIYYFSQQKCIVPKQTYNENVKTLIEETNNC